MLKWVGSVRALLRVAVELRRIADSLEYFAQQDAMENGRMFIPSKLRDKGKDESEVLYTPSLDEQERLREEEDAVFMQQGVREVERLFGFQDKAKKKIRRRLWECPLL